MHISTSLPSIDKSDLYEPYIPNFKSPLNGEARDLYNNDKSKYSDKIQEWVKLYSGKVNTKYNKKVFDE